jgi:hypothetical protein
MRTIELNLVRCAFRAADTAGAEGQKPDHQNARRDVPTGKSYAVWSRRITPHGSSPRTACSLMGNVSLKKTSICSRAQGVGALLAEV